MRMISRLFTIGIVTLAGVAAAQAEVRVSFDQPGRYADAGLRAEYGSRERAAAMREIRQHLERLGARYLRPDQFLSIDVRDIDLAGGFEPLRAGAYNMRILREVTWPRITVRYTLQQDGLPPISGEETIRDINYLMRPNVRPSSDALRYEKAMLDEWFKARFVERRVQG